MTQTQRRRHDTPQPAPAQTERREGAIARIGGTETAIDVINAKLRMAEQGCHLLTAASTASPPVGCAVAFNVLRFGEGDVYSVGGGKYGLSATALMRVASALRISWDGTRSGRIDNGRDPRFVAYRAVGWYRALDGQVVWVSGEVELDLNDDSDMVAAMRKRSKTTNGFESQLRDTRLFLLRHAETKAKARAIRQAAGIRGYTEEELRKPFVVPALVFTGHSDDPVVRQALALEMAKTMLSAESALYGGRPPEGPGCIAQAVLPQPIIDDEQQPPLPNELDDADDWVDPDTGEVYR